MIPPIVFFQRTIYPYTLTAIVGVLAALLFAFRAAKKQGLDKYDMLFAILIGAAGGFLGSHFVYALTKFKPLIFIFRNAARFDSFGTFLKCVYLCFSGSVFYGGLIFGVLFMWLYLRKKKTPIGGYMDVCAISVPLFHGFGRIGCFLSGCCYGVESKCGFVMNYLNTDEANGVRRFPVQLCEAVFNFALAAVLYVLLKKKILKGRLMNIYLYAYPAFRFFDEFLRGDRSRGIWLGLSTSQWISLLLIAGNTVFLLISRSRKKAATETERKT